MVKSRCGVLKRAGIIFIAKVQMGMLEKLVSVPGVDDRHEYIPLASALVEKKIKALQEGRISLDDLFITPKLSYELGIIKHHPQPPAPLCN
jgi:hypothetical protein